MRPIRELREAKIHDAQGLVQRPGGNDHEIRGLEIAMNNAKGMGRFKRVAKIAEQ